MHSGEKAAAAAVEVAGSAWSLLSSTVKATAAFAAETGTVVGKRVQEANLGEKIAGVGDSLASVAGDPTAVKETASNWWGGAVSGATTLWNSAATVSTDFIKSLEEDGSGGSRPTATDGAPRSRAPPPPPQRSAADDDWLQSQLSEARSNLGRTTLEETAPAGDAGWEDNWGGEWDDGEGGGDDARDVAVVAPPAEQSSAAAETRALSRPVVASDDSGPESDGDEPVSASAVSRQSSTTSTPSRGVGATKVDADIDGWDDW